AEGSASLDFSKRHLTLVQPSESLRRQTQERRPLDPATLASFKEGLFGRHLQVLELDRKEGDQLTRELEDFVRCVRTGSRPRVSGEDGLEALTLAARILDSLRSHPWQGDSAGPCGPWQLPAPLGPLFQLAADEAAA